MSELRDGQRVGRYRLGALLGEGGMGRVYQAHDETLHRDVALKVVQGHAAAGTDGVARLLREARAAAAFTHPNAVTIFDVGEHDGMPYLAMELVVGRTLRAFVGDGTVPLATQLRWLADIGRAIAAAHRVGLMHRDLKPENVMLRDDGVVKVLDFGLARRADDLAHRETAAAMAKLTGDGIIVGTPLYMAPEQLQALPLDVRVDQFAWGVVAYELITGDAPWTATTSTALVAEIMTRTPPPLEACPPFVPKAVASVVARALAKAPNDRFPSMDALVTALEAAASTGPNPAVNSPLAHATTLAEMPAPVVATPKRARRLWPAIVGTGVLLVAGAAALHARSEPVATVAPIVTPAPSASAPKHTTRTLPPGTSSEARNYYLRGVQELRDGATTEGHNELEKARNADPSLAAAYVPDIVFFGADHAAVFRGAFALRASLDEHDRKLVEAVEPMYGPHRNLDEATRRVQALEALYPEECEPLLLEANVADFAGNLARGIELSERAATVDPACRGGALNLAGNLAYSNGQLDREKALFTRCVEEVPQATGCSYPLAGIAANEGDCRALVDATTRRLDVSPNSEEVARMAAFALDGVMAPEADVMALLHRAALLSPKPAHAALVELDNSADISLVRGDFTAALAKARQARALAHDDLSDELQAELVETEAIALRESGDAKSAGRSVLAYFQARGAYSDPRPMLAGVLLAIPFEAGLITRASALAFPLTAPQNLASSRDVLLIEATRELSIIDTPETARAAIAHGNSLGLLPDLQGYTLARAYMLAGDIAGAIEHLRAHARLCDVADRHGLPLLSAALLGSLLEKTPDLPGACEAYGRVLTRWGHAKPRSVTADRARARWDALHCKDLPAKDGG